MMQAAPSFTAVSTRQTLHRNPSPSPPRSQKVTWSPNVRQYVQRAFEQDNAIPGIDQKAMSERLKIIITNSAEAGNLETIDWSTYPLPQHLIKQERDQAALYGTQDAVLANFYSSTTLDHNAAHSPIHGQRKRKSPDAEMSEVEDLATTPPWKKQDVRNGLEDRITGKSKTQEKKQKKIDAMRANAAVVQPDMLEKRRQRFAFASPEPSPYLSTRSQSPVASGPVVGTCQKLEKNYFRLTAPPAPEIVRPLPVLELALSFVLKKWRSEHKYSYVCDQMKSLRQDLTVQHIKNEFTVKVYEVHARIALEMGDLGEYNQCQTQLRALYKLKLGGTPDEFVAYRILYYVYTRNRTDLNDVLADLTPADKKKQGVQHALQVRSALASGNYHKFFRLYSEAPFLGGWLLDMFVKRERLAAMAAICKAYKPDITVHFLAKELGFDNDAENDPSDSDSSARRCVDFLCEHEAGHLVERRADDVRFLAGKAGAIFERARATAFQSVDIKGQI